MSQNDQQNRFKLCWIMMADTEMVNQQERQEMEDLKVKEANGTITDAERVRLNELKNK